MSVELITCDTCVNMNIQICNIFSTNVRPNDTVKTKVRKNNSYDHFFLLFFLTFCTFLRFSNLIKKNLNLYYKWRGGGDMTILHEWNPLALEIILILLSRLQRRIVEYIYI